MHKHLERRDPNQVPLIWEGVMDCPPKGYAAEGFLETLNL